MFNFKSDFFSQQPVEKIIPKNEEVDQQEVPQQEMEMDLDLPASDDVEQEIKAVPAEDAEDNQGQGEALVSKTKVFYHPQDACVDVDGGDIQSCPNIQYDVMGITKGVVAKIPVLLAELAVQVNIDAIITLPERALEVKDVNKRVKLTQCLLLQPTNMLFLRGFIRKNIEYATRDCSNTEGVCGDIRHCTVDVPFSCTTPVTFNGVDPLTLKTHIVKEFEYFTRQDLPDQYFAEKDELLAGDFSEFNKITEEFYNERPFCELIKSKIVEFEEHLNRTRPTNEDLPFEEKEFSHIEEKIVLSLTIKVLQNQQVQIPPSPHHDQIGRNEAQPPIETTTEVSSEDQTIENTSEVTEENTSKVTDDDHQTIEVSPDKFLDELQRFYIVTDDDSVIDEEDEDL